jgi:CDP-paratose 2-epimerase
MTDSHRSGGNSVLVTGGAGFIGSHVVDSLAIDGREVRVIDNLSRGILLGREIANPSHVIGLLKQKFANIDFAEADIRHFPSVKQASKGVREIIHTAAQVAVTASILDAKTDFDINALGTLNVLEAARLNDSTVVFCSTNKVYGENVNEIPVREEPQRYSFDDSRYTDGIPENFSIDQTGHSPYGSSKLAADIYVQDFARTYGLKTGVFRMSCVYGERQFGLEDQGWLSWFVIATKMGWPITIFGNGKQVRDVLYVKDLIQSFTRFLESSERHGVFNMGGGPKNTLSLLELLDLIRNKTGRSPSLRFADWRNADQKVYISDIKRAKKILNWEPRTPPLDGVVRVINWVEENEKLFGVKKLVPMS